MVGMVLLQTDDLTHHKARIEEERESASYTTARLKGQAR